MENTSSDSSSNPDRDNPKFDLSILKKNPQLQQLLLMTLSAIKQQQNDATATIDNDKRKFEQLDTSPLSDDMAAMSDHGSPGSDSSSEKMLGRPGRKPLTEYEIKMSEMDPKSKRKAQNRAAQRAFRERRVNYVKELEDRIKALEENQGEATEKILDENKQLKEIVQQLQMENAILGGSASSFDIPLSRQLSTTDNTNSLISTAERPQKLLRSIGNDSNPTLHSATTTLHDSSSPDSALSFTAPNRTDTTNGSSPSPPTLPSSERTVTAFDDALSNSSLPTDILNTFDASQLIESFILDANSVDPELFNTLTTNAPTMLSSSTPPSDTAKTNDNSNDSDGDTASNELMESLLVIDDDDTDSSSSAAAASHSHSTDNGNRDEHRSLPQVWDTLTEHPRFDEFDIDFLCEEMKRKAVCNDGKPCNNKSHQQEMQETIHQFYPSPSFC